MKIICQVGTLILALFIAGQAGAHIRGGDLERKVAVTERQQLLAQVDIVSLYLTSCRVGWRRDRRDTV